MIGSLLLELQMELEKTDRLLIEASRIASSGSQKMEDGSVRRPSTKKRKKQKLTPEQKKKQKQEQKLVKKVKEKLKDRTYKSRDTGKDLLFNTAYNRRHPKAVADFNKAMEKARGSKGDSGDVNYSVAATLNDEQYDLLSRMNNGRDMRDMSLVEERTMRDIFALLVGIHEEITEEEQESPKERKTRSDKGKPRGPRVKDALTTSLEEEGIEVEDFDVQEASEITEKDVKKTKGVLDERAKEREEQTGEEEPKPKAKSKGKGKGKGDPTNQSGGGKKDTGSGGKKPPKEKPPFVEGAPLLEQPSYVQKAEIKDRLEKAFRDKLSRGTSEKIKKLEEKLQDPSLNDKEKRDLKEQIAELEKKDLASTRKSTRTLVQRISETVDALDDLTEDQVQQMVESYGSGAVTVEDVMRNQGLEGLQNYLEDETKDLEPPKPPPSLYHLSKDIKFATDKVGKARKDQEDAKANQEMIASVVAKLEAKGNLSQADLEKAKEEISSSYIGTISIGSLGEKLDLTDFTSELVKAKESFENANSDLDEATKKLNDLQSDLENYEALKKEYAQNLGSYLAITHAQKSIVEDPEFGLAEFPSDGDEHDREKHLENVRRVQGRRFKKMTEEQREKMVGRVKEDIDEVEAFLEGKDLSDEQKKSLQGKLANLKSSETALNTIRMIKGEGVMEGYAEVPDQLLELARQTGSEAWEEGISMLSQQGTNPSKTRELIESVTENLDTEDFKAVVGGEQGPYGEMLDLLDDNYCPGSATNNAKGVGDKKLSPSDDPCPNPLSDNMKKMLRDYMSGGFVNLYTVEKESYRDDGYKTKGKEGPSKKVKEQMKLFWRENKDKFFEVFVDGVDESTGKEYTEEEREAAGEEFRTRWRIEEMRSSIDGVSLYSDSSKKFRWEQIMEEIEKVKSLDPAIKRQRLKEIRTNLLKLFDDTSTQENVSPTSKKQANIFNRSFIDTRYKSGGTKIMQKRSTQYVDYQRRSQAFELGMRVYPFLGGNPARSGIVVAIFPAIGMVDVQFPHGASRYPVEDLVVDTSGDYKNLTNEESSVPGGLGTVPVSSLKVNKSASRVASNYVKQAIYWYKKDRTYRQCRDEEKPCCPKCKTPLGNTVYKRRGGKSEKLLACYTCLFIIKPSDIVGG